VKRKVIAGVFVVVLSASIAFAAWLAAGTGTANALGASMPTGATPTGLATGSDVTVAWAQSLISGDAVAGYIVKRYDAADDSLETINTACVGEVAGLTCTESSVPDGTWKYTVTPKQGQWLGTESAKSAGVVVTTGGGDTTPPAAPALVGSTPASPSNNQTPNINGTAEADSTITLYTDSSCTSSVAGTGTATSGGSFSISVTAIANTTTTYYGTAKDAANNTSVCSSTSVAYTHDDQAPAAPSLTSTDPASPANNNSPKIIGSAESGSRVRLYRDISCTLEVSTTPAIANASDLASGITVSVTDNTSTTYWAKATDAAGNPSACSDTLSSNSSVTYVEDSAAPAKPLVTSTTPASPANNNSPKVIGSGESGSKIKLYSDASCTTQVATVPATPTAADFAAGLTVSVANDTSTTFYATATDAALNPSDCSTTSVTYVEDSTAPGAPTVSSLSPASPANENNPEVIGTAEAGSTVTLFKGPACSTEVATGSATTFGSTGLTANVADNTTTSFFAKAADASGNVSSCSSTSVTYIEDSANPNVAFTFPTVDGALLRTSTYVAGCSTAADTDFCGSSSDTGSGIQKVEVSIQRSDNKYWDGSAFVTSPNPIMLSTSGIASWRRVFNPVDDSYTLTAVATDNAGNSASATRTFTFDSIANAPTLTSTNPSSPANNNSPKVIGTAESGSTVTLYTDSTCTTSALSGPASAFTSTGLTATVSDNTSTTYWGKITDAAGNTSACSSGIGGSISYVEDSQPPALPTVSSSDPASPSNVNTPKIIGSAEAGSTVTIYTNSACTSSVAGTGSAATFASPGISVNVLANTTTAFFAKATDAAGNQSACSTTSLTYVEDSTTPIADAVSSTNGGGGTAGRIGTNDSVVLTFSEVMKISSIVSGWTGSPNESVTVSLTDGVANNDTMTITTTSSSVAVNLGSVELGSKNFLRTGTSASPTTISFTNSSMALSTPSGPNRSRITIVLGTLTGGGNCPAGSISSTQATCLGTDTGNSKLSWSPSNVAMDLAGNPASSTVKESGNVTQF
jgi:hypothetical protein